MTKLGIPHFSQFLLFLVLQNFQLNWPSKCDKCLVIGIGLVYSAKIQWHFYCLGAKSPNKIYQFAVKKIKINKTNETFGTVATGFNANVTGLFTKFSALSVVTFGFSVVAKTNKVSFIMVRSM